MSTLPLSLCLVTMLRLLYNGGPPRRLLVVVQHRRASSVSASPRIISRRAWQEHLHTNKRPPPPKAAQSTTSKEEKPWPRSLQIAGCAMAAFFIPYSLAWFAASNGSARALVHSDHLDDLLRHHFGEPEQHTMLSYYDIQRGEEPKYQLDGEPTFRERLQQMQVEALDRCQVKVRVRVDDQDDFVETTLPGSTRARADEILQLIGKQGGGSVVALDFGYVVDDDADTTMQGQDELTADIIDNFTQDHPVTKETNIYSLWHYLAPQQQHQQQQQSSRRMSSYDVEVARLEHEIQVLQRDLNDVYCTRDRDDMMRELNESKSTLRKLKWKRRLGF